MLTPEQIQNLKPGDKLALSHPLIFREYDSENDELLARNNGEYIYFHAVDVELPSEHGTSVPTPKHDPTRLFREGDKVRLVERYGRKPFTFSVSEVILTVAANEDWKGMVSIAEPDACDTFDIHYSHLELVTPVEELEPYHVQKSVVFDSWRICNRNNDIIFQFNPDPCNQSLNIEEAEKLARAECDYLNERFRDLIGKAVPVEDLEPYSVVDAHTHWDVADKDMKTVATYSKGFHPNAKAAAEAERDRLNAEWRKEQK